MGGVRSGWLPTRPSGLLRAGPRPVRARLRQAASSPLVTQLRGLDLFTRITVFGATFLLSALPCMVLVSSLADRRIEDDVTSHLGLDRQARAVVAGLFQNAHSRSTSALVLALLLSVAGSLEVAGLVQSSYEQVLHLEHVRSGLLRLLVWFAALLGWFVADGLISAATQHLPGGILLDVPAVLVTTAGFSWWSLHFLLHGRLTWRRLLLPALTTAVLWLGLQVFAALYFSTTIVSDSRLYGTVGVVFSLLTWFMAISAVIVLGAFLGETVQTRRRPASPRAELLGAAGTASEARAPGASDVTEPTHRRATGR